MVPMPSYQRARNRSMTQPRRKSSSNNRAGLGDHPVRTGRRVPRARQPKRGGRHRPSYRYPAQWAALRRSRIPGRPVLGRGLGTIFCHPRDCFIRFDAKSTSQNTIWLGLFTGGLHRGVDNLVAAVRGAGGRDCLPGEPRSARPEAPVRGETRPAHGIRSLGSPPRDRHATATSRPRDSIPGLTLSRPTRDRYTTQSCPSWGLHLACCRTECCERVRARRKPTRARSNHARPPPAWDAAGNVRGSAQERGAQGAECGSGGEEVLGPVLPSLRSAFRCHGLTTWKPSTYRRAKSFEPATKGLRDRNSPMCTLSQNGYGAA